MNRLIGGLASLALIGPMTRGLPAQETLDFTPWRRIAVLDGGRAKPLETLAQETVIGVVDRASLLPTSPWTVCASDIADWAKLLSGLQQPANPAAKRIADRLPVELMHRLGAIGSAIDVAKLRAEGQVKSRAVRELYTVYAKDLLGDETQAALRAVLQRKAPGKLALLDSVHAAEHQLALGDQLQADLVRELTALLDDTNLFSTAHFPAGILEAKLQQELATGPDRQQPFAVTRLNRSLLSAAFPNAIRPVQLGGPSGKAPRIESRSYSALELYVTWLLTWQGWDHLHDSHAISYLSDSELYRYVHKMDSWDRVPMINARYQPMAPRLKPERLATASFAAIDGNPGFLDEAEAAQQRKFGPSKEEPSPVEEKMLEARNSVLAFMAARSGMNLRIGAGFLKSANPNVQQSETEEGKATVEDWYPLGRLLAEAKAPGKPAKVNADPSQGARQPIDKRAAELAELRQAFFAARTAFLAGDAGRFSANSQKFADLLAGMGQAWKTEYAASVYPTDAELDRELHYNRFQPFLLTTVLAGVALVALGISLGISHSLPLLIGLLALGGALGGMAYGMGLRVLISGRAPVSTLYETMIWAAFACTVFALGLFIFQRNRWVPLAAALVVMLTTLLAHIMPVELGSSIQPLAPVLRKQYWLVVHVMTIVFAYGVLLLAWALGNFGMISVLVRPRQTEFLKGLARFTLYAMQTGTLLLITGTILGGVWAAESWGRFWGWDPKEVGAFVAAVIYLIIFHARFVGLLKTFGVLAAAVVGFGGVVFAWYGVNFVLGVGLHAYAFGTGGTGYILAGVVGNLLLVLAASLRNRFNTHRQHDGNLRIPHASVAANVVGMGQLLESGSN